MRDGGRGAAASAPRSFGAAAPFGAAADGRGPAAAATASAIARAAALLGGGAAAMAAANADAAQGAESDDEVQLLSDQDDAEVGRDIGGSAQLNSSTMNALLVHALGLATK